MTRKAQEKIRKMVDRAYELSKYAIELKSLKEELREFGRKHGMKELQGTGVIAKISPNTVGEYNSKDIFNLFKDMDRLEDYHKTVKIKAGELESLLGKTLVSEYKSTTTDSFGRITFKNE